MYVIPPDAELTIHGSTLHLARPVEPRGKRLPIDVMFSSLARELGEHAIGVVLSGMGSDGTQGLQAIKSQGGLTLAQQPASAQFDSMPRSAIAAGCVDIIALPADMAARIVDITGCRPSVGLPATEPGHGQAALDTILGLLHNHTRHDLALYKSNTLVRRINRRVAVHGLDTLTAYADFLRGNPQELDLLFKEMLIGVTAFFRDPEAWQDLQDKVLPTLIERHAPDSGPMRAWVVGCSTGEEAYSLAIAFTEALDTLHLAGRRELQIFATDLNADAIAAARNGRFAAGVARDLSPQRLARFFTERPDGYLIDKRIRDRVLFAQHDVVIDPPFTRLDILSCRNLMIYFGTALQKRLVPLFHYSLRPGGALLLGGSETVGRTQSLFHPLHAKSRLYWRGDNGGAVGTVVFPTHRRPAMRPSLQESPLPHLDTPPANLASLADQLLLQTCAPPRCWSMPRATSSTSAGAPAATWSRPPARPTGTSTSWRARPSRAQLAVALRTALQDKSTLELRALRLDEQTTAEVDITVQAVKQPPRCRAWR